MRAVFCVLLLMVAWPLAAQTVMRNQVVKIPQGDAMLVTSVCAPSGAGPFRIAVISHGRAPDAAGRAQVMPLDCGSDTAEWFTDHGFVTIAPVRIGYGETGGPDVEADRCTRARDYNVSAAKAALAIEAAIAYGESLPFARKDAVVVVGQSAGGMASLEYGSHPRPEVVAIVNFAGGNGGHMDSTANKNCFPDLLAEAAGRLGAKSKIPELWIYAKNDSYFAPDIAETMYAAFVKAGGQAQLVQPAPFGRDGHLLFYARGGMRVWGSFVERYLEGRK